MRTNILMIRQFASIRVQKIESASMRAYRRHHAPRDVGGGRAEPGSLTRSVRPTVRAAAKGRCKQKQPKPVGVENRKIAAKRAAQNRNIPSHSAGRIREISNETQNAEPDQFVGTPRQPGVQKRGRSRTDDVPANELQPPRFMVAEHFSTLASGASQSQRTHSVRLSESVRKDVVFDKGNSFLTTVIHPEPRTLNPEP